MRLTDAMNRNCRFSDTELRKMYDACEMKYGKQEVKWSRVIHHQRVEGEYTRYSRKWTGQEHCGLHFRFGYTPACASAT